MSDRLLTIEEVIKAIDLHSIPTYESLNGMEQEISDRVKEAQDAKTANHFETVILPARIAQTVKAERERVIDEIETSLSATCRLYPRHCSDYDRCFINKNKCTTYLVQQLKQEG